MATQKHRLRHAATKQHTQKNKPRFLLLEAAVCAVHMQRFAVCRAHIMSTHPGFPRSTSKAKADNHAWHNDVITYVVNRPPLAGWSAILKEDTK
ncbi:hypothetical protein BaRGS_00012784 [Batillaria attramentaria]|uniref:Uncharacterized protein n=1 Tax=Batillaria attramentaria TaxID=370345 RepID=A0ABD0LA29_9CAEN